jgi:hypothetical protein
MRVNKFSSIRLIQISILFSSLTGCLTTEIRTVDIAASTAVPTLPAIHMLPSLGWTQFGGAVTSVSWTAPATGYSYQCRFGHTTTVGAKSFSTCSTGVTFAADGGLPEGLYQLDIKLLDKTAVTIASKSYQSYFHHSLDAVATCVLPFTDAQAEAAARLALPLQAAFGPTSSSINPRVIVKNPADVTQFEFRTLRRQFVPTSDGKIMIGKRLYPSRVQGATHCEFANVQNHKCIAATGAEAAAHAVDADGGNGLYICKGGHAYNSGMLEAINSPRVACDVVAMTSDLNGVCLKWNGMSFVVNKYLTLKEVNKLFHPIYFGDPTGWARIDDPLHCNPTSNGPPDWSNGTRLSRSSNAACDNRGAVLVNQYERMYYIPD